MSIIAGLGLVYSILGAWMWKKPPRKINLLAGYRTARSMKSQAAWDFAQVYAGRLMLPLRTGFAAGGSTTVLAFRL